MKQSLEQLIHICRELGNDLGTQSGKPRDNAVDSFFTKVRCLTSSLMKDFPDGYFYHAECLRDGSFSKNFIFRTSDNLNNIEICIPFDLAGNILDGYKFVCKC